jgi:hypothetical protein
MEYMKRKVRLKGVSLLVIGMILLLILVSCNNKGDSNTLTLKKESEHFEFYSTDKDKEALNDLEKALEDNYDRISEDLGVKLENKIKVNIYPDIKYFHNEIGMSEAEDWLVGLAKNGEIFMVSPLNHGNVHNYDSLMKVIVHEYTHILVGEINNYTDIYINEGIAVVESKQISDSGMKEYLKYAASSSKLPSIDDMKNNYSNLEQPYAESGGFVDFLLNKYGYENVIAIIKEPGKIEYITEKSKDVLEEDWIKYILENY